MKLSDVITQTATLTSNSGVSVERSVSGSYVSFIHNGESFAYLQGDEADAFNDECTEVYNKVQILGMDVVELSLAWPYCDLMEGV